MKKYQKLYHKVLDLYQNTLGIADDDQALALACYHRNPDLFALHHLGGWHKALTHFQKVYTKDSKNDENQLIDGIYKIKMDEQLLTEDVLRKISELPNSDLCDIMNKYGSDKGNGHHNYTKLYNRLFFGIRYEKLNIFEIGIGTVNRTISSNMCGIKDYQPGASIRGWKEYFPNAKIYCCDIDPDTLIFDKDDRITDFYLDQTNNELIRNIFYNGGFGDVQFDIVVDDGIHSFKDNWRTFEALYEKLKENGGIYIIEDVIDYDQEFVELSLQSEYNDIPNDLKYQYVTIPNPKNEVDNNLFIIFK